MPAQGAGGGHRVQNAGPHGITSRCRQPLNPACAANGLPHLDAVRTRHVSFSPASAPSTPVKLDEQMRTVPTQPGFCPCEAVGPTSGSLFSLPWNERCPQPSHLPHAGRGRRPWPRGGIGPRFRALKTQSPWRSAQHFRVGTEWFFLLNKITFAPRDVSQDAGLRADVSLVGAVTALSPRDMWRCPCPFSLCRRVSRQRPRADGGGARGHQEAPAVPRRAAVDPHQGRMQ